MEYCNGYGLGVISEQTGEAIHHICTYFQVKFDQSDNRFNDNNQKELKISVL